MKVFDQEPLLTFTPSGSEPWQNHYCPWPPPERDPETGFFRGEQPRAFSPWRMAFPPGPGRKQGPPKKDLTGEQFGKLIVTGFAHRDERSRAYWQCRCDCGNETVVRGDKLSRMAGTGRTVSCGCVGYATTPYDMQNQPVRRASRQGRRELAEAAVALKRAKGLCDVSPCGAAARAYCQCV